MFVVFQIFSDSKIVISDKTIQKGNEQKAEYAVTSLIIAVVGLVVAASALFIWAYNHKVT